MSNKAIIAMSGGVDSSVAAALMLEQGYHCIGITLKLYNADVKQNVCEIAVQPRGCCSLSDVNDARNVAFNLGMAHYVLNFTGEFEEKVIRHFVETYEAGATPNPCIECNRHIKFNSLLLRARQLDFDLLVTGHYARIAKDTVSGRYLLKKALDEKKDQSYVLYCLTQQQLQLTRFPLGELSKNEVRKIAGEKRFVNASKGESQDICFVPDGNYADFIEKYTGKRYPPGEIIDTEGNVIGRHKGLIRYTIGQRRGLGIAANIPVYVASKSVSDNTVTLAADDALFSKSLTVNNINLIACEDIKKPLRVMVKTRYLQAAQSATAEQTGEDSLRIDFDSPQRAITPGQAAVMYDGDIVAGGGTIC
ncbi:MAG: tRNA 2-thiouridine(34) synthase MnmA [Treponema sp.]|nr:tRNA 2-thiouridine(34) synthase MnmA [Treponema sp.]